MSEDQIFQLIETDASLFLHSKEEYLKDLAVKALKSLLEMKLDNVSEKPLDTLKRLDKYVSPLDSELQEKGKEKMVNSVIVRIFSQELEILRVEKEQRALDAAEADNGLLIGNKSDEDEEDEEQAVAAPAEEIIIGDSKTDLKPFNYFQSTFRISDNTDIN